LQKQGYKTVKGSEAFELYDTYGFPFDLTELILKEKGMTVSKREFDEEMAKQKSRSRADASQESSDWIELIEDDTEEFVGYTHLEVNVKITKYRKQIIKGKERYLAKLKELSEKRDRERELRTRKVLREVEATAV
jgi:alanyl-tRNA synthetase